MTFNVVTLDSEPLDCWTVGPLGRGTWDVGRRTLEVGRCWTLDVVGCWMLNVGR